MKKIFYIVLLSSLIGFSQTKNSIKTTNYRGSGGSLPLSEVTYFDGLGRPIQKIAQAQSNSGNDIVTHIEYNSFGQQTTDYLPYPSTQNNSAFIDPISAQTATVSYYQSNYGDSNPFSEKILEESPLERLLKQAAPGNDWAKNRGHEIKYDYQTNTSGDQVKRFSVTTTWSDAKQLFDIAIAAIGNYNANELYKNIVKNENWVSGLNNTIEEFKDKEGRIVLKREYENTQANDTYYAYDIYGNLSCVIPPLAEGIVSQTTLEGLCYQYKYDYRNRVAAKKLPGKQWEFIVYDKQSQPVATGPAFSPYGDGSVGILITQYDVFNRVIQTGWQTQTVNETNRGAWQVAINAGNNPFVLNANEVITKNYYDNYTFPNAPSLPSLVEGQTVETNVKGFPTGSWVRTITNASSLIGETSYTLYDNKYRSIRTNTVNYLGGFTQVDAKLDFSGKQLYTITTHKRANNDPLLTIREDFTYSAQDRLLTHTHQINGGTKQLLTSNTYDELGQLITKKVGGTDVSGTTGLQKVDYKYNIRGWLTDINNIDNLTEGTNPQDLFAFRLKYNNNEQTNLNTGEVAVKKLFNGNISESFWVTANDNIKRKYGYEYDDLNRLLNSKFQKFGAQRTKSYDEYLTYYKNGNIKSLVRNGENLSTYDPPIDNLDYVYDTNNPNRLIKVTDGEQNANGFNDVNKVNDDYSYDLNGNMKKDLNKGITTDITYNHLNLPLKIVFPTGNIEYLYNATGQKVKKTVTENNVPTVTDYLGGFQYKAALLDFFPHAEGYVKRETTGTYVYVFNYTDHLGNVRISYQDMDNNGVLGDEHIFECEPANPKTGFSNCTDYFGSPILDENNYYSFGLKHDGYNYTSDTSYKYKFNGKELQDELGLNMYDYGARNYDPALGRWMNMDPLAEKYNSMSPYNYTLNNPVLFIDPDGMDVANNPFLMAPDWHPDKNGNLVADAGDSTKSLAEYQGISYDQAAKQLADNGYKVNDKGILNLNVGDSVNTGSFNLQEVVIGGGSKKSGSDSSTPWMDKAESQLGVKERTNNNDGRQVETYLKSVGLGPGKNSYWCGAFVNWSLNESGIDGVKKPSWALNWRKFGESLDQPAYGAIATKTRNGGGHVGFVAGRTPGGSIVLLGGNQDNSVNYSPYPASVLKYNYPKGYKPNFILPTIKVKNGKTREQ